MRRIQLRVLVPTTDPNAAFERLIDFSAFPALTPDVRSVHVEPGQPRHTGWAMSFRHGVMRWREVETIDRDAMSVHFEQTDGDFERFTGRWRLVPVPTGCEVRLDLIYDFGIDSLAGLMDPLAERVIVRAVTTVLHRMFGTATVLAGGEALADLPTDDHWRTTP